MLIIKKKFEIECAKSLVVLMFNIRNSTGEIQTCHYSAHTIVSIYLRTWFD